jgi:hypothetical protein
MIAAWRIPTLTEKLMAATLQAGEEERRRSLPWQVEEDEHIQHLVEQLLSIGYTVRRERAA